MSASTSRKSFATSRFARSTNSGIGLDGSLRRKKSATASSARIASWRDLITPPANSPPDPRLAVRPGRPDSPLRPRARQLASQDTLRQLGELRRSARSKSGATSGTALAAHPRVDAVQRRDSRLLTPRLERRQLLERHLPNAALIGRFVRLRCRSPRAAPARARCRCRAG